MAEPSIITKLTSTPRGVSPSEMEWHNERADAKGALQVLMQGQFTWLSATNFTSDWAFPGDSELLISMTDTSRVSKQITRSRLIIKDISQPSRLAKKTPEIRGRSPVIDYRPAGLWTRMGLYYEIRDGNIPAAASPIVRDAYLKRFPHPPKRSGVFWVCIAIPIVSGLLLVCMLMKKRNHET
jgi:hypothetical protein